MTMIPMESIGSRTTTTDGVPEDPMAMGGGEQGQDPEGCEVCRAVLKVGEHGDVEPHHQPLLNAALLSLVQGVSDVAGTDGMRV